jgi:hypothetical protein
VPAPGATRRYCSQRARRAIGWLTICPPSRRKPRRRAGRSRWRWPPRAGFLRRRPKTPPFRLVAVGDADFASNSFFPYLANADLLLGAIAWLIREERAPVVKPPVEYCRRWR